MTLTREEILIQSPGIQLDQWVSMYVMGYETRRFYRAEDPQSYDEFYFIENQKYENVYYPDEWQPSKYIDAAWKVVEMVSDNKFNVNVMRRSDGKHFVECRKVGNPSSEDLYQVFSSANTASEAICKAALLAVLNI